MAAETNGSVRSAKEQHEQVAADAKYFLRSRGLTTQLVIPEQRDEKGAVIRKREILGDRLPNHPLMGPLASISQERVTSDGKGLTVKVFGEQGPLLPLAEASVLTVTANTIAGDLTIRETLSLGLLCGDDALNPDTYRIVYTMIKNPEDIHRLMAIKGSAYFDPRSEVREARELERLGLLHLIPNGMMGITEMPKSVVAHAIFDYQLGDLNTKPLAEFPSSRPISAIEKARELLFELKTSTKV